MKRRRFLGTLATLTLLPSTFAYAASRSRYDMQSHNGASVLVMDLPAGGKYRYFHLDNPPRLVVDLPNIDDVVPAAGSAKAQGVVRNIRTGKRGDGTRVVIDLAQKIKSDVSVHATPQGTQQLWISFGAAVAAPLAAKAASKTGTGTPAKTATTRHKRSPVIAIDAGHGGKDPGCVSANGHYEKSVVLSIGHKLESLLKKDGGFQPVLTRSSDIFIPLHQRILLARNHHADMFISLHADAAPVSSARGASVYVLSEHGSSSAEARWLAESENSSDKYASIKDSAIYNQDKTLRSVLLDLSMTGTLIASRDLGETMLGNLKRVTNLHNHKVNAAGFAVLKSPDIPSILVEHGFMSNTQDCARLLKDHHQQQLAEALYSSVSQFFKEHPLYA